MLKIKDNVRLEQLKKFGLEPIYDCDSRTGDVYIRCIVSGKYSGKFDEDTYVNIDLLYDLIKADIVEKIKD